MSAAEKSIKVIGFTGKTRDFRPWKSKFMARGNKKKYTQILDGTLKVPKKDDYDTANVDSPDATQKDIISRYELNSSAYDDLILAMDTETTYGMVAFAIVDGAKTADNPMGDAHEAWTKLTKKYAPETAPSFIALERLFANSKLRPGSDPDAWITYLEDLKVRMNKITIEGKSKKTDMDLIIHILANVPASYEVQVDSTEDQLRADAKKVNLAYVREKLVEKHARDVKYQREGKSDKDRALAAFSEYIDGLDETAMAAFVKQFKGLCNKCGKYGHKGADCPEHGNAKQGGKFPGNCYHCGEPGHMKRECPKRALQKQEEANLAAANAEVDDTNPYASDGCQSIDELGFMAREETPKSIIYGEQHHDHDVLAGAAHVDGAGGKHVSFGKHVAFDDRGIDVITCRGSIENTNDVSFNAESKRVSWVDSVVVIDGKSYPAFTRDTRYGDTACSCHLVNDSSGMYDVTRIHEQIGGSSKVPIIATLKGKQRVVAKMVDGTMTELVLDPVKYSKDLTSPLLSMTCEMSHGAQVSNDADKNLVLSYLDGSKIVFDRRVKTKDGWVSGVNIGVLLDSPMLNGLSGGASSQKGVSLLARGETSDAVTVNEYHEQLGHPSMDSTKLTATARGVTLKGPTYPCKDCAIGKGKQKGVPKEPVPRSTVPGEKLFIDISSPKTASIGGSQHWLLVLDDCTDCPFSFFLSHKDMLKLKLVPFVKNLKELGITVKVIRCDNAGENIAFEKEAEKEKLGLTFEYTAPKTPQQNGRVERKFQTLYGRVRAMLIGSGIDMPLRNRLWSEAANTATLYDSIIMRRGSIVTPLQKFFGKGTASQILDTPTKKFGEECVVADRNQIKSKVKERGKIQNWLGFASNLPGAMTNHPAGTYRILNPRTGRVRLSRDVTFLREDEKAKQKEAESKKLDVIDEGDEIAPSGTDEDGFRYDCYDSDDDTTVVPDLIRRTISFSSSDDSSISSEGNLNDHNDPDLDHPSLFDLDEVENDERNSDEDTVKDPTVLAQNPKVLRAMKKLQSDSNPHAQAIIDAGAKAPAMSAAATANVPDDVSTAIVDASDTGTGRAGTADVSMASICEIAKLLCEIADVADATESSEYTKYVEPKTFDEAWNHPDPEQRRKWREAITKEFTDMKKLSVWRKVKRSTMPANRRCVKCKWVFKIKRDGRFRARLVACGYSQIPGVDFQESFSPVCHDATLRILLICMIIFMLSGKIADVETAFLNGSLEEEIFMDCPPGMDHEEDECLLLLQCIYGLVQSARQYHKKIVRILHEIGFTGGDVDPCLFVRRNELGICFIAIYVDDNLLVGHPKAIDDVIDKLRQKGLTLTVEGDLHDYLSCHIVFSPDRTSAWLGQPHLTSKLREKFGDEVKGLPVYLTPGTPNRHIVREENVELRLPKAKQTRYRSGVGMLLYFVKHSRPDISNTVRELSKVLDFANELAYREMLRCIKFVLDSEDLGLKIAPTRCGKSEAWQIVCFTDSDYAGDPQTRRSVTGYIIYVMGVPVIWRSKSQKCVTLSSSEAEWYALSEAVKEVIFVLHLLEDMKIKIELPITVHVDNVGTIFMSQNVTTSSRTKHIDTRTKFVREFQEDGVIKAVFVCSENNISDIMTKNVSSDLHRKHGGKLVVRKGTI